MYLINKTTLKIWIAFAVLLVLSLLVLIANYEYELQMCEYDLKKTIKAHNNVVHELRMANSELADYRSDNSMLVNEVEETIRRMQK